MKVQTGLHSKLTRRQLKVGPNEYAYFSIGAAEEKGLGSFDRIPASLAVVLENLLRNHDETTVNASDIESISQWLQNSGSNPSEIMLRPARVLMQDFTGVPAIVDLAAMRDGLVALGGDPKKINPLSSVDLVIDHSVMIDSFGNPRAFQLNVDREYERNLERYEFLKWGQSAFDNFRVVPPGTGICHQVNLEYLSKTIWSALDENDQCIAYPDTLVGTDSHTTMVNGLAVLGWGVGGIEAEAAMLGQPLSMLLPEVVGFKLTGEMVEGTTATDLVLKVVQLLREKGVVGKFVEFYGDGLDVLPLADRATIANMAPEYGATCGYFPIDNETLRYLKQTGRDQDLIELVEAYAKENRLWRDENYSPIYTDTLELDMGEIVPAISGPKRPQDHIPLDQAAPAFQKVINDYRSGNGTSVSAKTSTVAGEHYDIKDGSVVIASITSCTNTSNPYVMIGAGLVARKAKQLGLKPKPWVKTSLAPGSKVVSEYLERAGLQEDLDALGFNLVGYGCTTCIGNSGPLQPEISQAIANNDIIATSVLSGNRNFEGRISPDVRANFLASPPLVVAYAIAGDLSIDITRQPLGHNEQGSPVYLKDVWSSNAEIAELVNETVTQDAFLSKYADVFTGDEKWQSVPTNESQTYGWPATSTYVQNPPYFENITIEPPGIDNINNARCLVLLGDTITTDHISPAGSFKETSPAGKYLQERQVTRQNFNSYGSRRGNHEVMMRGTFANIRIKNEILDDVEGGYTLGPDGNQTSIFDAAMGFKEQNIPLVVVAGKQYGTGSSRDWAAKGTALLGIKAVIAESFERIHRSNLVGMGVIPFEFTEGDSRKSLQLKGSETFTITGLDHNIVPGMVNDCQIQYPDGTTKTIQLKSRIDTEVEVDYINHNGVLHYVLRKLANQ
ncbi:MAG: aconitate hydratase AcnA [Rhodobacteraceae bacterium]|nr:aconitate hydratase AcnA [Paracoccaceae bacterium]